jgi:type I restriction enzyme S subunit
MNETKNIIPEGYKTTKLGVIPEDWKVLKFNEIAIFNPKADKLPEKFTYIDLESVKNGIFTRKDEVLLSDAPSRAQRLLKKGDVLFQTVRPYQKNNLFFNENGDFVASSGYAQLRAKYSEGFLFQMIFAEYINNQVMARCTGTSFPAISAKDLSLIYVKVPSLPEQQKIASILSTWDKAIAKQESLITQKEHLKKGLMQDLLTGKKRFAGFEEEWEEVKMKDALTIGSGKDYKHLEKGNIPVYGSGGVMTYVNKSLYSGESVGIGRKGTIDKPVFLDGEFWTVDTLFYTHSFVKCTAKYIYYLFKTIDWYRYNEASGVPSLSKNTIYSIKINLPSIEEQQKIADTLSSADKEIENLKTQLATMKLQKQGLMQELLTGKRRVKLN